MATNMRLQFLLSGINCTLDGFELNQLDEVLATVRRAGGVPVAPEAPANLPIVHEALGPTGPAHYPWLNPSADETATLPEYWDKLAKAAVVGATGTHFSYPVTSKPRMAHEYVTGRVWSGRLVARLCRMASPTAGKLLIALYQAFPKGLSATEIVDKGVVSGLKGLGPVIGSIQRWAGTHDLKQPIVTTAEGGHVLHPDFYMEVGGLDRLRHLLAEKGGP